MFSKFLVTPRFSFCARYSTAIGTKTPKVASKSFISSLFVPKQQIDLTKCRFETAKKADIYSAFHFIESHFFKNDPLCKSLHFGSRTLEGPTETLIRDGIKQGMTLLARDSENDEIIGISMNTRSCPWDGDKLEEYARLIPDVSVKKLLHIWALMAREPRLHQELSQLSIFELGILAVEKSHEGRGLGSELVRRSLELGTDLNFKYARLNCTNEFAIKIAEKMGMTRLWDVPFRNIFNADGKTPLAVPEHPHSFAAVYFADLKNRVEPRPSNSDSKK